MAEYKVWTVTEPYLNIHCSLGEAPLHEPAANTLRFVDIKKRHLHTLSLASPLSDPEAPGDALFTLQLDMPVGVTADIEGVDPAKKILVGGKSGVAIMDRKTGQHELLQRFYDSKENDDRLRSNDGAVDPQGRFWIGTMNDFHVGPPQAEGTLFRFNHDLARHSLKSELVIPNGLGWSADQKTMYFTHSQEGKIYAFDYETSTGNLSNERIFYQHPQDKGGEPDGFAMDVEGNIWQCVYGEGRVLKISTEGKEGKVIGEIRLPTSNITCPTFIGTELWITTAAEDDETKVESKKYGGGLFKVDVGVEGKPKYKFKMEKQHSS